MDFDRILPLLVLYVFWRLLSRPRRSKEEPPIAVPSEREYGFAWLNEGSFERSPEQPEADLVPPDVHETPSVAMVAETTTPAVEAPAGILREPAGKARPVANSFAHLRRAVIWSEILAKPRGLRDHME